MKLEQTEIIKEYAKLLNRDRDIVREDLQYIKTLRSNIKLAYNKFFIHGDGWLKHNLNEFQIGVVDRLSLSNPYQAEVLPRFHTKTLLCSRIDVATRAMLGMTRYQLVVSLKEENFYDNLEAILSVTRDEKFAPLQWLAHYFHGTTIAKKRGNVIQFGNGAVIEFRSLLGEMRGINKAQAGGRPERIVLDDPNPTEAAWSETIRSRVIDRYLSMVVPLGKSGSKIIVVGTIMHRDDLVNMIVTGRIGGYSITPAKYRKAYDEHTHEVIFPERWTYEEIMALKRDQYDKSGKGHLFRRELLNDPSESDTHPLSNIVLNRYAKNTVLPSRMYRAIACDHAHGVGKDFFTIVEYGLDHNDNVFCIGCKRSQSWDITRRIQELAMMIKHRNPHVLAIEDTSESKSFIELVKLHFARNEIHTNLITPSPHERGSKNIHILERLQGRLIDKTVFFPEEEQWAEWLEAEMANFDMTSKTNVDDLLDASATAFRFLKKPSIHGEAARIYSTDPLSTMIMSTIKGEETQQRRNRIYRRW